MLYYISGFAFALILFLSMIFTLQLGQIIGKKYPPRSGFNITEGAVFTLMGLLVAFTFASSNQRFDLRRTMMIDEANAISTSYLRLSTLPTSDQQALKKDYLEYIESRLALYNAIPDFKKIESELAKFKLIQNKIWRDAIIATKRSSSPMTAMLVLPSINTMFDIANTRTAYSNLHPHILIFILLITVAVLSAFLAGYGMAGKEKWQSLHVLVYLIITTITIYIIIDLEYPRLGFLKESSFDSVLIDVKHHILANLRETQ